MSEQPALLQEHGGSQWVVYVKAKLQGVFSTYGEAFKQISKKFPEDEMLIRKLETEKVEVPFVRMTA